MKNKLVMLICGLLFSTIIFAAKNLMNADEVIQQDLNHFAKSWNQGNIHAVIEHYEQSPTTTLIWSQLTRGYADVKNYLLKNYPSQEDMGTLSTSDIKIQLLSPQLALVTGNWLNKTNGKEIGGPFSMIYEKTDHGWKILVDHG